jgi:DNA-binding MarR family transcriptional regulator
MTLRSLSRPRDLDDLLNYRLMRLLAVSGAPVVRLCEGRYGISRREWRIVALLAAHGAMSPSALADRGDLDRARTSRAIGSLVSKKLVQRVPQPGDARRAVVALSDAGRALYDELFPQVAELNRCVLEAVEPALVVALDEALTRLTTRAAELNRTLAVDVQADRHRGGSRHRWPRSDLA